MADVAEDREALEEEEGPSPEVDQVRLAETDGGSPSHASQMRRTYEEGEEVLDEEAPSPEADQVRLADTDGDYPGHASRMRRQINGGGTTSSFSGRPTSSSSRHPTSSSSRRPTSSSSQSPAGTTPSPPRNPVGSTSLGALPVLPLLASPSPLPTPRKPASSALSLGVT